MDEKKKNLVPDYWRQLKWFDPTRDHRNVAIIGCGATGSLIGVGLAKMGVNQLTLIDHDTVEAHNIPNQFFPYKIPPGISKVVALEQEIKRMSDAKVAIFPGNCQSFDWAKDFNNGFTHVVLAVDNVQARIDMLPNMRYNYPIIIDPSTGGLFGNVVSLFSTSEMAIQRYSAYLAEMNGLPKEPADCSAVSIIFTGFGIAGEVIRRVCALDSMNDYLYYHSFHDFKTGQVSVLDHLSKEVL